MTGLKTYHLSNEDEFEEVVVEAIKPVKTPEMWSGVYTARNMDALELAIAGLHTLGAHELASELQLLYVQGDLMRPK